MDEYDELTVLWESLVAAREAEESERIEGERAERELLTWEIDNA